MTDQRDRELAAILAGLRLLQREFDDLDNVDEPLTRSDMYDIATNIGSFSPLTGEEIEALCQRLNTEWELMHSDLDTCEERVKESARE